MSADLSANKGKQLNNKLRVRLFGRVSLSYNGREFSSFETSKARDLLVLLASLGGEVSRADLQRWLWPGDPALSGNRLSVALYQLKQMVAGMGVERSPLLSGRGWIALVEGSCWCDVRQFMVAVRSTAVARVQATWLDSCSSALGLYHGRFAPGSGCPRVIELGGQFGAHFVDVALSLATHQWSDGRFELAVGTLRLADLALSDYPTVQSRVRVWVDEHGEVSGQGGAQAKAVGLAAVASAVVASDHVGFSCPTVTALVVAPVHAGALALACEGLPIHPMGRGQAYVIAPNPLVTDRIAKRLKEGSNAVRALITTFVGEPTGGLPKSAKAYFEKVPRGEVWLGRATAALLEETDTRVVTERTTLRNHFRLV